MKEYAAQTASLRAAGVRHRVSLKLTPFQNESAVTNTATAQSCDSRYLVRRGTHTAPSGQDGSPRFRRLHELPEREPESRLEVRSAVQIISRPCPESSGSRFVEDIILPEG